MAKDEACYVTLTCFPPQAGDNVQYSPPLGWGGVGNHVPCHLDIWGQRQLSLLCQELVSQNPGSVPTRPLCSGNPLLL